METHSPAPMTLEAKAARCSFGVHGGRHSPKGRLGNRKTTTGCKTCKNRKLKCDEAKPSCARCSRAGRLCLGYSTSPSSQQDDSSPDRLGGLKSPNPSLSPGTTTEESELVRFFIQHAARGLAGLLDAEFWASTLPQLSSSWQSVRFGLLSISALLRARCRLVHGQTTATTFGLKTSSATMTGVKYYKKALEATRTELAASNRRDLAILTCILFFCIECLQGRDDGAFALCRAGQTILDQSQKSLSDMACYYPMLMRSTNWMFARVRIVAALHGHQTTCLQLPVPRATGEQEPFVNLCEARWTLLNLTTDVLALQKSAADVRVYGKGSILQMATVERNRNELLQTLKYWRGRAADFLTLDGSASRHQHLARLVLNCHDLASEVLLKCLLDTSEMSYDDFKPSFQQIVQNSSQIIAMKSEDDQREYSYSHFQLETGVMLPLYLTVCKCRDAKLRTEALELIQQGPEQEGLWHRERLTRVARRIMEIEGTRSSDSPVPGEYGRLVHSHMDPNYRSTAAGRPVVRVSFVQRLKDQSRRVWEEELIH